MTDAEVEAAIQASNLLWREANISQILWLMEKHGISISDLEIPEPDILTQE